MLFVLKTTYLIMRACAEPCCTDLPDSPTFAELCCADSPDSLTFAEPCCADSPSHVTQTRRHSTKAIFEKNVTRLDKFARVTREWSFLTKKSKISSKMPFFFLLVRKILGGGRVAFNKNFIGGQGIL
jgi:hypothetical protein